MTPVLDLLTPLMSLSFQAGKLVEMVCALGLFLGLRPSTACLLGTLFTSVCLAQPPATASREPAAPQSPSPKHQGVALAIDGQYDRALKIFQMLLHEDTENGELNYLAGAACVRLDRLGEGIDYLEKSVKSKPGFPQAYGELAEACLKRRMKDRARAVADEGLRLFPKNEQLKRIRAKIGD